MIDLFLAQFSMPSASRLSRGAFWLFALTVALLPLGLGGNRPVPLGLAQITLGLAGTMALFDKELWARRLVPDRVVAALLMLVVVFVWAAMQTMAFLPDSFAYPLWRDAHEALKIATNGSIAVDPEDALSGLQRLVTYIASGCMAYVLLRDPERARVFLAVMFVSAVVLCIYGLVTFALGNQKILWFSKWAYENDLTSTFVNRNHFAIYVVFGMICGTALSARSLSLRLRLHNETQRAFALRTWLAQRFLPVAAVIAVMFLSIVLSHSRAGLMLSIFAVAAFLCAFMIYKRKVFVALVIVALGILAIGSVFTIARNTSERFMNLKEDHSLLDRLDTYRIIVDSIEEKPWLGYGLNGFQPIWRAHEQSQVMEFNRGHSDVMESILDLGIPAGAVLWGAIVLLVSGTWRGVRKRHQNGIYPCVGFVASVVILLHASTDFSLQIPALSIAWAALLGMGLAHSWSPRTEDAIKR